MQHIRLPRWSILPAIILPLFVAASVVVAEDANKPVESIVFYAMGDVPYAPEEDFLLPKQIAELPTDGSFVIHLGDIKSGTTLCSPAIYEKVDQMLRACKTPVFIIPGDNEWNDCLFPAPAWKLWEQHFMRFDQNWQHKLPVFRQLSQEENFAFTQENVLFLGINLVGGRIHNASEWKERHQRNIEWTRQNIERCGDELRAIVIFGHALPKAMHNDFFDPLVEEAKAFGKPILYLHGDGHVWLKDRPFAAKNILRVEVDQGGKAPPLKVTITRNPRYPFQFDRRLP